MVSRATKERSSRKDVMDYGVDLWYYAFTGYLAKLKIPVKGY